jgi:hypothetical protein
VRNRSTGKPFSIKSRKALSWIEAAGYQIPEEARRGVGGPDQPLRITFYVRYETRSPDLSTELILDTLQEYGVIRDDRYVFEKSEYKIIDREDPGVDLVITETRERNMTREQVQVLAYEYAKVPHMLVELQGPFEDGSVLTHWTDGEWFVVLADGETTGYEYDNEGQRPQDKTSAKLTCDDVQQIRRLYATGKHAMRHLGEMFGVSASTICLITQRKIWKHVP